MDSNNFTYQTDGFQWSEVNLKGVKKYYIEGYISTIDVDDYNEVVTMKAQEQILRACKQRIISETPITMDIEHEEFYKGEQVLKKPKNSKIPVAKIVHAEMKSKGVWVKAEINTDSGRFNKVWKSIKNGYLHSFSVAFATLKSITKMADGVQQRFIDTLNLVNVTLTGSPVNPNATFQVTMKAALNSMGENNMEQNNVNEGTPNVPPVTPAPAAAVEQPVVEGTEPSPVQEENAEQILTVNDFVESIRAFDKEKVAFEAEKALFEAEKAKTEVTPNPEITQTNTTETEGVDLNPLTQIKAKNKQLIKENIDLKARLNMPILKSKITSRTDVIKHADKKMVMEKKSPLDMI